MSKDIFEIINPTNTLGVCRPLAHILGACETIVYNALLTILKNSDKDRDIIAIQKDGEFIVKSEIVRSEL